MGKLTKYTADTIGDLKSFLIPGMEGLFILHEKTLYELQEGLKRSGKGYQYVVGIPKQKILQEGQRISPFGLCGWLGLKNSTALRFRAQNPDGAIITLGKCKNPECEHFDIEPRKRQYDHDLVDA